MVSGERRRRSVVEGPVALVDPRFARMLIGAWERYVEPGLRADGVRVLPADAIDGLEDLRDVAGRVSAVGSALDADAEVAAGSGDGEITTASAAERLERTQRQVCNLCRSGQLRARKVGASWLVDAASVEDHRAGRAAAG